MGQKLVKHRLLFKVMAKGRHGTHSPFAYAFVEQVLRPKDLKQSFQLSQIQKIIGFPHLYMHQSGVDFQLEQFKIFDAFDRIKTKENVFLLNAYHFPDLQEIANMPPESYCVIYQPRVKRTVLNELIQRSAFSMILDAWDWLLISNSTTFKRARFFRLR